MTMKVILCQILTTFIQEQKVPAPFKDDKGSLQNCFFSEKVGHLAQPADPPPPHRKLGRQKKKKKV